MEIVANTGSLNGIYSELKLRADIIRRSGGSCAWLESESAFEQMELYIAMISFVPKYHYSRIIEIIITNPSSFEN